ncbi:MAG: bifunctional riboflavin kinase/FAD synthetase [Clostridia bacterium]|nr:bifunctional riboflavin kinase/FAD synthetase [Clostridia bacterium]
MIIYDLKTMQACSLKENTVVALGTFDGCHAGHASVLLNAFYKAKELKVKSVVYTFDTSKIKGQTLIMTLEEKIKALQKFGIDYVAVEELEQVRNLSGEEFASNVLFGSLNAVFATCGFNYRFGRGASCTAQDLALIFKNNGGSVQISEEILYDGVPVSSTLIRSKIEKGEIESILPYSRPYSVYAMVEKGKGLGGKHGIATVNQQIPVGKVVPKHGVYITECEIGEDVYPSVTNIGYRPTTDGENSFLNMETHILGYFGNLYHSYVRVNFYKYLREEKRFSDFEELKCQIERDKKEALEYFGQA